MHSARCQAYKRGVTRTTPPCPACAQPMSLIGTAAMIPSKQEPPESVLAEYLCQNHRPEMPARTCGASMGLTL